METVTVSQLSQIAISLLGECSDTPVIFCVSNENDAFEAVTPVTGCCWRIENYATARRAKADVRVVARCLPLSQSSTRIRFMAAAVMRCWRCALSRPR